MATPDDEGATPESEDEDLDNFSWEDAQEDLQKQKQMITDSTDGDDAGQALVEAGDAVATAAPALSGQPNLDLILDIPLQVTVELGRTRMMINDLLQLNPGSVIELTKLVGEPLEVLINNKLVARGEVVVVNEKFGIRLTDIISPTERIEQLR